MKRLKNMKLGIFTAASIALAFAVRAEQRGFDSRQQAAGAPATRESATQSDPENCIKEAAQMNMAIIQASQLAEQKSQNPELKRFAEMIQKDHKQAQIRLEVIAKTHDVSLPTTVDEKCEAQLTKLRQLSTREFDQEFAKDAVEGHAKAVAHLEKASTQVQDTDLNRYVKDMLRETREHQTKAREIAKAVGIDQATITSLESKAPEGVGAPGDAQTTTETSKATPERKN